MYIEHTSCNSIAHFSEYFTVDMVPMFLEYFIGQLHCAKK